MYKDKKNGLCKLIMNECKKNVVLPREWVGIVVSIWSHHTCHDSTAGFHYSKTAFVKIKEAFLKSIECSWDHACFAILEPLAAVLTFLMCSFPRV